MKTNIFRFIGKGIIACAVAATVTATIVLVTPIAKAIDEKAQDQKLLNLFKLGAADSGVATPSEPTISYLDLEESIKACAELTTAEYDFSSACQYEKDGVLWFTGEACTFTYSGTVRAGIDDLSKAEVRINHKHQTITVYMPNVRILDVPTIDPSSIRTIDEQTGWFSSITVDEYSDLLEECCDHAIDRAQENNIISQAEANAEDIVRDTISSVIAHTEIADYQVYVRFGERAPIDNSLHTDAIEPERR